MYKKNFSTFKRMSKLSIPPDMAIETKCMLIILIKKMCEQYFSLTMFPDESKMQSHNYFYANLLDELKINDETFSRVLSSLGCEEMQDLISKFINEIKYKTREKEFCKYCIIENAFLIAEYAQYDLVLVEMIEEEITNNLLQYL